MERDRKQCLEELELQLKDCSAKIREAQELTTEPGNQEKSSYHRQLEDLLIKEKGAQVELGLLKSSDSASWLHRKAAAERALQSLRDSLSAWLLG